MADLTAHSVILRSRRNWLVLAALVVTYATFNLLCQFTGLSRAEVFVLGVSFAQPLLFATWAAIGPPPFSKRVPLTFAALLAVVVASGIQLTSHGPIPFVEMLCITIALFVGGALLIAIVGMLARWRIESHDGAAEIAAPLNQLSLKYLIALTTVFAVLLGLAHILAVGHASSDFSPRQRSVLELAKPAGLILLATFPAILIPLLILSVRPKVRGLIATILLWIVVSWTAIRVIVALDKPPWTDVVRDVVLIQTGAAIIGIVSAFALRFSGYRLLRRRSVNALV